MEEAIIQRLKEYFAKRDDVLMAFVFGSRAKGMTRSVSDWDIAVYLEPYDYGELETARDYKGESKIWSDITNIAEQDVDFLVLNRARPPLVFSILNSGLPLVIKDRKLYLYLLLKTHYEAVDYWRFAREFWQTYQRSSSLSPEDKMILVEHMTFLEEELKDIEKFRQLTWKEYEQESSKRRDVERWVENIVMASLDIAKIILASEQKTLPQTYKETLRLFGVLHRDEPFAEKFSEFAALRNIIVHEYLDTRWARIRKFIEQAKEMYPVFTANVKELIEKENNLS